MKRGEIIEGTVEYTVFPNKGYIRCDGCKVGVKGVLPGQRVSAAVKRASAEKAEALLREVLEKSPMETEEPQCGQFGICGSCTMQSVPYETQLSLKEDHLKRLLNPVISNPECEWLPIAGSPSRYEYRNKLEFSFGDEYKDGPLTLGFHRKGSFYDLANACDCRLGDADVRAIAAATLTFAQEQNMTYFHKMRHEGYLRHLLVRKAVNTGEILVDLVTTTQEQRDLSDWVKRLRELPLRGSICSILHTENDSVADTVVNEHTDILYGREYINETILGLSFRISAFSFFQTNSKGAEVLYSKVRDFVGETRDKVIFDLYSGTGTIGQLLAPVADKVIGIEIVEEAVEAAKANATLNGLKNCEFIAGDVLKELDKITDKPDFIVVDPPREGIHPKALEKIIAYGVDSLVYISCKPTSLANDLLALQEAGYHAIKIQPVDLFPQTPHVETVCLMSRK